MKIAFPNPARQSSIIVCEPCTRRYDSAGYKGMVTYAYCYGVKVPLRASYKLLDLGLEIIQRPLVERLAR